MKLVKVFINTHIFEPNLLEKPFSILSRWLVAELQLTDPLPELAVGDILEVELGVSRSESYIFESSHPHGSKMRVLVNSFKLFLMSSTN